MRQDAEAECCPKCRALLTTPCAYPNFRFRDCPQGAERRAVPFDIHTQESK
jgi:hypothetical protein